MSLPGFENYLRTQYEQAKQHLAASTAALEQHLQTDYVKAGEDLKALKAHIESEVARLEALLDGK